MVITVLATEFVAGCIGDVANTTSPSTAASTSTTTSRFDTAQNQKQQVTFHASMVVRLR